MAVLYSIENKITGKRYIGKAVDVNRRWWEHLNNVKKGKQHPLYDAIRKYGVGSFSFTILEEISEEKVNCREVELIEEYGSTYPTGYNLAVGGSGGNTRKGMTHEQKTHLNEKLKKLAKENVQKGIGISAKSTKGKHITDVYPEIAEKWEENYRKGQLKKRERFAAGNFTAKEKAGYLRQSEKKKYGANPRAAKIRCVESNLLFNSMSEAVKYYGLKSRMSIQTSIKTKKPSNNKHIKNLTFEYS